VGENRLLDSVFLLALLVGFYPALFFISNNWFFVGFLQSFLLVVTLSLATFIVVSIDLSAGQHRIARGRRRRERQASLSTPATGHP